MSIEKLVKGDLYENVSKFGFTSLRGNIYYKLKLTNTTGE